MKTRWAVLIGVAGGLLGAGILLLATGRPRGQPITLLPPPSPPPLQVQVAGAVSQPGVHHLPPGSRISDAIQSAGGLLPDANAETLNLAAFLEDGQQVWVPFELRTMQGETAPQADSPPQGAPEFPLNINTAPLEALDQLPGIGPVKAQSIISYREAYGPFETIEDIQNVSGIGPATFEQIKDLITVESSP